MFNILYLIMFDMLPYLLNVTFSFTNYPMGLRYNQQAKTCSHGNKSGPLKHGTSRLSISCNVLTRSYKVLHDCNAEQCFNN